MLFSALSHFLGLNFIFLHFSRKKWRVTVEENRQQEVMEREREWERERENFELRFEYLSSLQLSWRAKYMNEIQLEY